MWNTLTPDIHYDDNRDIVKFYDSNEISKNHIQKHLNDVSLDELSNILSKSEHAFNFLLSKARRTAHHPQAKQELSQLIAGDFKQHQMLKDLEQEMMAEYYYACFDWVELDDDRRISDYHKYSAWLRKHRYNQWCMLTNRFNGKRVALSKLRAYNKRSKQLTNRHNDTSIKRRNKFSNLSRTRTAAKNEPARKFVKIPRLHEQRTHSDWRTIPKKRHRAIIRRYKLGSYKRMSSVVKGYLKRQTQRCDTAVGQSNSS